MYTLQGFLRLFLSSGFYFAALVGIFTLLPLFQNVTFTKFRQVFRYKFFYYSVNYKHSLGLMGTDK